MWNTFFMDLLPGHFGHESNSTLFNLSLPSAAGGLTLLSEYLDDHQGGAGEDESHASLTDDPCLSLINEFPSHYRQIHGYLTATLCFVGAFVNIANIVVLTRKHMVTPVNTLLTTLAMADLALLVLQVPLSVMFYILQDASHAHSPTPFAASQAQLHYYLVALPLTLLCRTVAVWQAVAVATCRYVCVRHPSLGRRMCTVRNARITAGLVVVISALALSPGWLLYTVVSADDVDAAAFPYCLLAGGDAAMASAGKGLYTLTYSSVAQEHPALVHINTWLFALAAKILPPTLLALLTGLLSHAMCQAESRRRSLLRDGRSEASRRARDHNLATAALFVIVVLQLCVELPQGIMAMLIQAEAAFAQTYEKFGDIMNVATLVAMSINFFVYTTMMKTFRSTVRSLVLGKNGVTSSTQRQSSYSQCTVCKETDKDHTKDSMKDATKGSAKGSTKYAVINSNADLIKEDIKDSVRDSSEDSAEDAAKDSVKNSTNDSTNHHTGATIKGPSKELNGTPTV